MSSLQVITATAKEWIAALNRLTPATSGKKALPILHMLFIDPAKSTLRAVGKDVVAETAITTSAADGAPFLVNYAWLKDAITSTTGRNRNADVQLNVDGNQVTLWTLGYRLTVETMPADDFPESVEHHTFASHSAVDAIELRDALGRGLIASSKDETLPILVSVRLTSAPEGLRLWSTDRYRLISDMIVGPGYGEESFTLPAGPLRHMVKQFGAGSVYVDSVEDGPVIFKTDETAYTVTPIDGSFPSLASIFEFKPETVVDVDRAQLLDAAKVANRMSDRYMPASLSIEAYGVQVKFNDGLFGPDLAPLADGTLTGDPVEIALNTRFFLEALNSFKGKTVRIYGANPNKRFMFVDGGADLTDGTAYRHVLMPVRMPR